MIELSIIIPFYNGMEYIRETLESVQKITHTKEIIIVDDGSCRKETLKCGLLTEEYKDLRIVRKRNGGIASARNEGMEQAEGEYLLFVDQDDKVAAETIDAAIDLLRLRESKIAVWSTKYLVEGAPEGDCDIVREAADLKEDQIRELVISMLLHRKNEWCSELGHIWSCLFQREFLEKNCIRCRKFVDIEDDYLFVLDSISAADRIAMMDQVGYYWRKNLRSESHRIRYISNILEKQEMLRDYLLNILRKQNVDEEIFLEFESTQQIMMYLKAIVNCCSVQNRSLKERKLVYKRIQTLDANKFLHKYTPEKYQKGFRNNVWKMLQERKYLRVMLYADIHSIAACIKRRVMKETYGS